MHGAIAEKARMRGYTRRLFRMINVYIIRKGFAVTCLDSIFKAHMWLTVQSPRSRNCRAMSADSASRVPFKALMDDCQMTSPINSRMIARGIPAGNPDRSSEEAIGSPEMDRWLVMKVAI
jgi:hypothetical protein